MYGAYMRFFSQRFSISFLISPLSKITDQDSFNFKIRIFSVCADNNKLSPFISKFDNKKCSNINI